MNKFWIMVAHTYLSKIKTKSFIITTFITVLLLLGLSNISTIIEAFNKGDEVKTFAVLDESNEYYEKFETNITARGIPIHIKKSTLSEAELDEQVQEEKVDGMIILSSDPHQQLTATVKTLLMTDSQVYTQIEQILQQTKQDIGREQLGLNSNELNQLFTPVELHKVALEDNAKTEEELNQARGLVYVLLFVIYFSVIMYASMIATEVATEKSSRVMEILISSVSPVKQMFAKLIGIGLLSITQMLVILGVGYASISAKIDELNAMTGGALGFSAIPTSTFVYAGIYLILGYFLFATLAAFLGSLVSRIEDVQQLISPMIFLIVAAFMIAMFGLSNPAAPFITISSYIPFFTPMIMFLRVGMLNIPAWEIGLSITVLLVSIILLAIFGARVYKGGVLIYGKSSSFKDLKRALMLSKDK
ncbi:ABC transporter permease [Metabacillus sediminilitoris]|uniref:ABC transporter permease n=1 Tax=Metabacillus sediminilitoris TaxID=2567941 RepID=A0A4S4BY24_9BACI|nr:ABC transporter permease [Metabacillus sediminilitoris]QGQ44520.1 ABC transporter permease [Metabacillus sediminilitoris]THF80144.1 ABC transporter permease [Metabacillus sediminilitoris]